MFIKKFFKKSRITIDDNYDIFDALWSSPATMPNVDDAISDEEIVEKIKNMSDLELTDDEDRTLLMNAVIYERPLVVECLLKRGVDINKSDCNGFTALHFAVQTNNHNIIKMLLKAGISVNVKNKFGNNAILLADNNTAVETIELLLQYGSDPHQKNNHGFSAMEVLSSDLRYSHLLK